MNENREYIPGQGLIYNGSEDFTACTMILVGPPASGKTLYCLQFLRDGIKAGEPSIYINCSSSLTSEKFKSYFTRVQSASDRIPLYVDVSPTKMGGPSMKAASRQRDLSEILQSCIDSISSVERSSDSTRVRVALDSLTNLVARYSIEDVGKFVSEFYDFLKTKNNLMAIFTLAGSSIAASEAVLGSLVDGIVQLRIEDSGEDISREIRILSLKSTHNTPRWVRLHIEADGSVRVGQENKLSDLQRCRLCDLEITGATIQESGFSFHPHCLDTYRKLGEIYGSHPLYALQPGVVTANFFFIDIVGLSDPHLSVEKQIRKIEQLNTLIGSCDAYSKEPNDKKITLPTGDGMVIGYLVNPELPLQLSIQLHQKLRAFNAKQPADKSIGVRIGLSSGPVFVVTDINNNQNVWGPGIILARRVMDLGDDGHILLADNIAETLRNLKDEYLSTIKLLTSEYRVKHGEQLKLYSAYSQDFGNPAKPTKISESF